MGTYDTEKSLTQLLADAGIRHEKVGTDYAHALYRGDEFLGYFTADKACAELDRWTAEAAASQVAA